MKTIKDYENYDGINVSIDISLFEYGLIWAQNEHCDKSKDEYQFIYGVGCNGDGYNEFDHGYMTKDDFIDLISNNWFDLKGVCETCDTTKQGLIDGFPYSIYEAISYHGYINVFGDTYNSFEIIE